MNDWTHGYIAEIGYTYGYYGELNPSRAALPLLYSGYAAPRIATACELGFGQGVSVNLHAAGSTTQWHATDFNPQHALFAQSLATVSGASAHLFDQAFADFCARADLPDFDFIGIHGIWSWISQENRSVIVDFIHRKLKLGGVLYISYNCMPGWAATVPMRNLFAEYAETMGAPGAGIVTKVDAALKFADELLATDPAFFRANPQQAERIGKIKEQNRQYLAHEYFNKDWQPMSFSDMHKWLAPAKLAFVGSANYLDHVDSINLSAEQQKFLAGIENAVLKETVRDFMINQQFRRDYWVKGARKLPVLEQGEALREQKVVLLTPKPDVNFEVGGARVKASLSAAIYQPILDILGDHQPHTLAQIEEAVRNRNISFPQLAQAILILCGKGNVSPAQEDSVVETAQSTANRLNTHLMQKARGSADVGYLASPVTGGGYSLSRVQLLFLLALDQGETQARDCAAVAWQLLARQGQKLVKQGKTLETAEENLAELTEQASEFIEKRVPILKALRIR